MKARKIHNIIGPVTPEPTGRRIGNYYVMQNTLLPQYPGTGIEDIYVNHMVYSNKRYIDGWNEGQNTNEAIDERAIYKTTNTGVNYTSDAASTIYSYITNDISGERKEAGIVNNKLYILKAIDASTTSFILNADTVSYYSLNELTLALTKIVTLKLSEHLIEFNGPYNRFYPYLNINNNTLVTLDASGYSLNTAMLASTALNTVIANNLKCTFSNDKAPATLATFTSQNTKWLDALPITGSATKTNVCTIDLTGSTFAVSPLKPDDYDYNYIGYMAKSINVKDCVCTGQFMGFDNVSCEISNLKTITLKKCNSDSDIVLLNNYSGPDVDLYTVAFSGFNGLNVDNLRIVSLANDCTSNIDISVGDSASAILTGIKYYDFIGCRKIALRGSHSGSIFKYPAAIFVHTCNHIYLSGSYSKTTYDIQIGFTIPPANNTGSCIEINGNDTINTAMTTVLCDCFSSINLSSFKPNTIQLKCVDSTRDKLTSITWFTTIGSAAYIELSNLTEACMQSLFNGLGTVTTTVNINIIAATYARLSTADIAIATNKGYTVTKEA